MSKDWSYSSQRQFLWQGFFWPGFFYTWLFQGFIFSKIRFIIDRIFLFCIISFLLFMSFAGVFSWEAWTFFNWHHILANIYILLNKSSSNELKLLSFLGLVMLVFYPVGSAGGFYTAGRVSLWFSVPIGIEVNYRKWFRDLVFPFLIIVCNQNL